MGGEEGITILVGAFMSSCVRHMSVDFRGKVCAGNTNMGVIGMKMVSKAMQMNTIT